MTPDSTGSFMNYQSILILLSFQASCFLNVGLLSLLPYLQWIFFRIMQQFEIHLTNRKQFNLIWLSYPLFFSRWWSWIPLFDLLKCKPTLFLVHYVVLVFSFFLLRIKDFTCSAKQKMANVILTCFVFLA